MKPLPKNLQDIVNQEYPTFNDNEFLRHRKLFDANMAERAVSCVIVRAYGHTSSVNHSVGSSLPRPAARAFSINMAPTAVN